MAKRDDRAERHDLFRFAMAQGCDMAEARVRKAAADEAARMVDAQRRHEAAMARLRAKGWRGGSPPR